MQKNEPKKSPDSNKKRSKGVLVYSDIAFKMLAIILAGVFGGKKLDAWLALETPVFTLSLTLISVGLSMYVVIKGLSKND